jgi:Helix-turn-helix.
MKDLTTALVNDKVQNLGELLKIKREEIKLTQEELAEIIDVNQSYITQIESRDKIPSPIIF